MASRQHAAVEVCSSNATTKIREQDEARLFLYVEIGVGV